MEDSFVLQSARPLIAAQFLYKITGIFVSKLLAGSTNFANYGVILLKYEFFHNSMLFFARDCIKTYGSAVYADQHPNDLRFTKWSPLLFGTVVGFPCFFVQLLRVPAGIDASQYRRNFLYYFSSFLLECICEPFSVECSARNISKMKLLFDVMSFVFKYLLIIVFFQNQIDGVRSYGLGQIFSSCFKLVCYLVYYFSDKQRAMTKSKFAPKIHSSMVQKHFSCIKASISSFLLHHADSLLCSIYFEPDDQGIYGVVSSYGNALSQLLFAPSGDALGLYISKKISFSTQESLISTGFLPFKTSALVECFQAFYRSLILYGALALLIFAVGFWNSKSFLYAVYGGDLASKGHLLLSEFILLTLFSSLAGIFETFAINLMNSEHKNTYIRLQEILGYFYFLIVHNFSPFLGIHALVLPKIGCAITRLVYAAYIIISVKNSFLIQYKWHPKEKRCFVLFVTCCIFSFVFTGVFFQAKISSFAYWDVTHVIVTVLSLLMCACTG